MFLYLKSDLSEQPAVVEAAPAPSPGAGKVELDYL